MVQLCKDITHFFFPIQSLVHNCMVMCLQARKLHATNKLLDLVDPTLQFNNLDEEEDVQQVIRIALMCAQVDSSSRPSMNRIVFMLQKDIKLEIGLASNAGEQELPEYDLSKWSQSAIASGLTPVPEEEGSSISTNAFDIESHHILCN